MTIEQLPQLSQSGVYLLSRDKKVSVSLEDFLVITLHSPSSTSTALILQSTAEHRADFLNQLDKIYEKYSSLSDVDSNLIQSKVFGAGNRFSILLTTLKSWLKRNHIPVVASDLGRALPGELVLEGASGRIGIQYRKNDLEQWGSLLSTGTARDRSSSSASLHQVLVLSKNPVVRTLAQQSIEEESQWSASCPESLGDSTFSNLTKTKWAAVVISDELKTENKMMNSLVKYSEANPNVPIAWIGGELPSWKNEISRLRLLPPMEPFLIPHFKRILKQSILDSSLSETSETFTFSKRKKAGS
ncbi:MAG: hypothetical protein EBQ92_02860 [Proteobacteria bacterium]|nr:hypothetical protein [Pseudomonadota bacterium]